MGSKVRLATSIAMVGKDHDDEGKLIVTISQNSIGNAITELLGVVVKRTPDADAYGRAEPELLDQLFEIRRRLVEADLGEGIGTAQWPAECRAPS